MAKIDAGVMKQWQDGETIHAVEYNNERNLIVQAYNDTDQRVTDMQNTQSVGTSMLQNGSVTEPKLASNSVATIKVQDSAITESKIADGAVSEEKMATNSVNATAIKDEAVTFTKLAPGAVTNTRIADGAVSASKIANLGVTTEKLAANSVTDAKIADGAVNTRHVVNTSINSAKLAPEAVTTEKIADGAVTNQKLQDSSVNTSKLINGAVTPEKIQDGAISSDKLADGAVTPEKITSDSVLQFSYSRNETDVRIADAISDNIPQTVIDQIKESVSEDVEELKQMIGPIPPGQTVFNAIGVIGTLANDAKEMADITSDNLGMHVDDSEVHVSEADRLNWDGKETTAGAQAKANAAEANAKSFAYSGLYGVATGLNTLTATIVGGPTALFAGLRVTLRVELTNTAAVTINLNGTGAKAAKKANGNNFSAGNLKGGSLYTFVYNGTETFILQGEGGEYGTATATQVLSGYTIGTEAGLVSGSMANRGSVGPLKSTTTLQSFPAGYYNQFYVSGDSDLVPQNILAGVDILGVVGTFEGKALKWTTNANLTTLMPKGTYTTIPIPVDWVGMLGFSVEILLAGQHLTGFVVGTTVRFLRSNSGNTNHSASYYSLNGNDRVQIYHTDSVDRNVRLEHSLGY